MNGNTKRSVLYGLIYLAFSFIISRLPLFNYLGYEFSVAIALIAPLIAGGITFSILKQRPPANHTDFTKRIFESLRINIFLLIVPLLVITINAFFVKNCSYAEGLAFFLLIPVVTIFFTVALAGFCKTMFNSYLFAYAVSLLLILIHPLVLGYTTAQIYSYNFLYGYFPGFSYDEILTISFTLIDFRFTTLIAGLFLLLVSIWEIKRVLPAETIWKKLHAFFFAEKITPLVSGILLSGLLLIVWWVYRDSFGFESSNSLIQRTLSAQHQTQHFRIHYAPASFTEEEIRWTAAEHEFRFHQVESALQMKFSGTIDSYIYPDADVKRKFIGTGNTNIAKPWRGEMHLNKESWQGTLKHELVHVLAGNFGMPVIHAHYHIGLVEGLATAIDGDWGNRTLHEYAAAMMKFGLVKNPARLIKPLGFALQSSSLSYVMMGSFCQFLIDRYGLIRFKTLYGGESIESAYGKSYEELVEEWQQYLLQINIPDDWREHVEFYFKRPSIFAKECARTIAKLNDEGWKQLANNHSATAMQKFSRSLDKSWNTEAFGGLVRSFYQAAQYDSVIRFIDSQLTDSAHQSAMLNLMLIYGDSRWYTNDTASAKKAYGEILSLGLNDRFNESASLRIAALQHNRLFINLFTGQLSDSASLRLLNAIDAQEHNALAVYLKAKFYFRGKQYSEAKQVLNDSIAVFDSPVLNGAKEQLSGETAFMQKNFQKAKFHFWQSLNYISNEASIRKMNDWIERCGWYEENFVRNQ